MYCNVFADCPIPVETLVSRDDITVYDHHVHICWKPEKAEILPDWAQS